MFTPPKREEKSGDWIIMAVAVVAAVIGIAAGVYFYFPSDDGGMVPGGQPTAERPPAAADSEPVSPTGAAKPPEPVAVTSTAARSAGRDELQRSVAVPSAPDSGQAPETAARATSQPEAVTAGSVDRAAPSPTADPDAAAARPLAASSYAWVLKSDCEPLPDIKWWKFKNHVDLARFVNRRYGGDWSPYVKVWQERLQKLRDVKERNSGVRTPDGRILKGADLDLYVTNTSLRLSVTRCLASAARDYENLKLRQGN